MWIHGSAAGAAARAAAGAATGAAASAAAVCMYVFMYVLECLRAMHEKDEATRKKHQLEHQGGTFE